MIQMLGYYVLPKNALTAKNIPANASFAGVLSQISDFSCPQAYFTCKAYFANSQRNLFH